MKRIVMIGVVVFLGMGAGCEDSDGALEAEELPEDLFEEGWDEISAESRQEVLRTELDQALTAIGDASAENRPHHERRAILLLSALRAELMTTDAGRAEYRSLEQQVEQMTGDAAPR